MSVKDWFIALYNAQRQIIDPYDETIEPILDWEGHRADVKNDRGGKTLWGFASMAGDKPSEHAAWVKEWWDAPAEISRLEAKKRYRAFYWYRANCDAIPFPFSYVMMDMVIHHGWEKKPPYRCRGVMFLQRALRIQDDGLFGPQTEDTINDLSIDFYAEYLRAFQAYRIQFMRKIVANDATQEDFEIGWYKRVFKIDADAQRYAAKLRNGKLKIKV